MKKINELLKEYLTAMDEVNPDRFQESYHGADPAYAKKVIKTKKTVNHIKMINIHLLFT